jgi:hypothetical protein
VYNGVYPAAAFARSSGNTLVYVSDTTGALQKRLAAGDALQKENRSSPDLSTPDTFKAALLKARSVSYVNPARPGRLKPISRACCSAWALPMR